MTPSTILTDDFHRRHTTTSQIVGQIQRTSQPESTLVDDLHAEITKILWVATTST